MTQRPSGTAGPTAALARLIEDLGWLLRVADHVPALTSTAAPCPAERAEIETAAAAALRGMAARLEGGAIRPAARSGPPESRRTRSSAAPSWSTSSACNPIATRLRRRSSWTRPTACAQLSFGVLQAGGDTLQACEDRAKTGAADAAHAHRHRSPPGAGARQHQVGVAAQQPALGRRSGTRGASRAARRPAELVLDRARHDVGAALERALDERNDRLGAAGNACRNRRSAG